MNFASWVILAIVIAIVAFAIRATFSKKKSSCCGCAHDEPSPSAKADEALDLGIKFDCGDCTACQGCATKRNCLQPTIKPL